MGVPALVLFFYGDGWHDFVFIPGFEELPDGDGVDQGCGSDHDRLIEPW